MSTVFIKSPTSWDVITKSLIALSSNRAKSVRLLGSAQDVEDDSETIDVVVTGLKGEVDFALEIYGKGLLQSLANDAIGLYIAIASNSNVIVPDNLEAPSTWQLLKPNGELLQIVLDVEKLNSKSQVVYHSAK